MFSLWINYVVFLNGWYIYNLYPTEHIAWIDYKG